MNYRPPARSRGESAISKRRNQRRQEQARLVAMLLLLGLLLALIVFSILGIRSCAQSRKLARPETPRRIAQKGVAGSTPEGAGAAPKETTDAPAGATTDKPGAGDKAAKASSLKQLSKRRYKPAPFAMIHDGKTLYMAQEQQGLNLFGAPHKEYPDLYELDSLSAVPLAGGRKVWEAALDANFSEMGLAAGNVILFNPYEAYALSKAERRRSAASAELPANVGLMLAAFNSTDGHLAWSQNIPGAMDASVAMDSKAVVVAYRDSTASSAPTLLGNDTTSTSDTIAQLASQLRIAAFNARSGDKAWGGAPVVKSLQTDQIEQSGADLSLQLKSWEGLTVYVCYNIAGLLQSGSGDTIATYTASGYIYATAYDVTVKTFYLLHAGARPGVFDLTAIPIGGKRSPKPSTVATFESDSEHFLLLAENGFVAVAHQVAVSAGQKEKAQASNDNRQLTTQLLCFQNGRGNALVSHRFASGMAVDIASVPGVAGEFLIALSASLDERGQPRGAGTLYRARSQDGSVWEVTARKEPVAWLMPFKGECLLLYKGGQIQRFIPESNKCVDLARGSYDYLEPLPGRSRTPAVLSSYPLGYLLGKSGQPLQVMVFE